MLDSCLTRTYPPDIIQMFVLVTTINNYRKDKLHPDLDYFVRNKSLQNRIPSVISYGQKFNNNLFIFPGITYVRGRNVDRV